MTASIAIVPHKGHFQPGRTKTGGRKKGTLNSSPSMDLIKKHSKDLTQKAIDEALGGNVVMLKLLLDKLIPSPSLVQTELLDQLEDLRLELQEMQR